jgi:hypothetical protein
MARIAPRPVLLISAGSMETEYTERYRAAAPGSTELWNIPDAGHTGGLFAHPDEYRARVLDLFDRGLSGATADGSM